MSFNCSASAAPSLGAAAASQTLKLLLPNLNTLKPKSDFPHRRSAAQF